MVDKDCYFRMVYNHSKYHVYRVTTRENIRGGCSDIFNKGLNKQSLTEEVLCTLAQDSPFKEHYKVIFTQMAFVLEVKEHLRKHPWISHNFDDDFINRTTGNF